MKKFLKNILRLFLALVIMAIVTVAFLVIYMTITDYKPDSVEKVEVTGKTGSGIVGDGEITFMSWNLGYGGLGREMNFFYDKGRMVRAHEQLATKYRNEILAGLQGADSVDFFLLQEIDQDSKRTYYHDQLQQLQQGLPGYNAAYAINYDVRYVPVPIHKPYGKVKAGMGTFSSVQPESAERHAFKGNYSWPMNLFMLDRCYIRTSYPLENGRKLIIINTHNSAYDDGSLKYEQLGVLKEAMFSEYEKGNYVVVGGDWNMTAPGYHDFFIKTGDRGTDDKPAIDPGFLPEDWTWAFNRNIPTNRDLDGSYIKARTGTSIIDYFVLSPNIELVTVRTGDLGFENTDHNPVVIKVRLK